MVPLTLTLSRSESSRFSALLQRGVTVLVDGSPSVHGFLTEQLGLPDAYVQERITTVFLDGQVVDVLEDAVLRPGSLLALSAAMPGLVGAALRRGGYYSGLRAAITRVADRPPRSCAAAATVVRVKLFNLLIQELGPVLLGRGIVLAHDDATQVLDGCAGAPDVLPAGPDLELQVRFA